MDFEASLAAALALDHPYDERSLDVMKSKGVSSAVLMLFGRAQGGERAEAGTAIQNLELLYTQRTELVDTHKGQIAFPGGRAEAGESAVDTALRETEEEVGISRERVHVVGTLPSLYTVTGFTITPVVGILNTVIEKIPLVTSPNEIARTMWIRLADLTRAGTYRREVITAGSVRYPIHVYQVAQDRIWGATGSMTKNLLDRLRTLG